MYRTETYYRTESIAADYDFRGLPVEVFDFIEYVKIRSGIPVKADEAFTSTTTFEDHVQRLPDRLQRIIGRVSYSEDDLEEMAEKIQKGRIIFVSDGSMASGRGTSGYKIVDPSDPDFYIMGSAPCDSHPDCIQSFRAELSGILGEVILSGEILRHLQKTERTAPITTYCDNTSALQVLEEEETKPGIRCKLGPDYDIITELRANIAACNLHLKPRHVKGHQDRDKSYEELPFEAQMNCDCDEAAGAHMRCPPEGLEPQPTAPFFPSSKAGLRIDGKLITSNVGKHVRLKREGTKLRQRIISKEGWIDSDFDKVDWASMEIALKKLGRTRFQTRVIQFQHRWLPLGRQQNRIDSERSKLCPICKEAEETQSHFLRCTHRSCQANLIVQLAVFHRSLQKKKILGAIWTQIKQRILYELGQVPTCPACPSPKDGDRIGRHIQLAVIDQANIGWINFLRGRTSVHWGRAQGIYYSEAFPDSKTLTAQTFQTATISGTWTVFHGMWEHRNNVLHDKIANVNIDGMNKRITQLYRNPGEYVRPSSLCLFEAFSQDECISLHPAIKQTWLQTIYLAIKTKHGDLKCLDDDSQTNITDFF